MSEPQKQSPVAVWEQRQFPLTSPPQTDDAPVKQSAHGAAQAPPAEAAKAGVRMLEMTGAVQATAPTTAARLMTSRRERPFSVRSSSMDNLLLSSSEARQA